MCHHAGPSLGSSLCCKVGREEHYAHFVVMGQVQQTLQFYSHVLAPVSLPTEISPLAIIIRALVC